MQLFEMQGLLAGKCLPADMLVGESLSQYFLRQFNQRDELACQVSALQTSQDNIINGLGIKGDGPVSKLVIEYVMGLVAENVALKQAIPKPNEIDFHDDRLDDVSVAEQVGFNHAISKITKSMQETPNTEAFTSELRAQGVEQAADELYGSGYVYDTLKGYVANLRAGSKG